MGNELTRDQLDALGEEYFRLDPPYRLERVLQMAYALGQQNAEGMRRDAERLDHIQKLTRENGECWIQQTAPGVFQLYYADDSEEPGEFDSVRAAIDAAMEPRP